MKTLFLSVALAITGFLFSACSSSPASEKLLLAGSGWNKMVIIDKASKQVQWEYPLEAGWECNSAVWTPDGKSLFSYKQGARLMDQDGNILWNIPASEGSEFQTARVLPDGNYLVASCGHPARILEVNQAGDILFELNYETGIEDPHAQFRQIYKNAQGNYMMPLFQTAEVREISPKGEVVRTVKLPGNGYCVIPLPNGNYLAACGDSHCYVEFNLESGEILRTVKSGDIEGTEFCFVAQLLPTADGGLYICNWQGHDPTVADKHIPQLIEIDKSGKIVWDVNDNQNFGMISSISVVE